MSPVNLEPMSSVHTPNPVPHFSLRGARRVPNDQTIDFQGQNYEIATTLRKSVSLVHHPNRKFWVVEHPPKNVWPPILGTFNL